MALTWAVAGSTCERDADDDVAEVIGAGDRGDDHDQAQRRALIWAGEVGLAGDVERVGAGAGAGDDAADLAGGRARGRGLLVGAASGLAAAAIAACGQ